MIHNRYVSVVDIYEAVLYRLHQNLRHYMPDTVPCLSVLCQPQSYL